MRSKAATSTPRSTTPSVSAIVSDVTQESRAVLVVGAQAAGKSSVGRALAARLERAAFVEGDVLWKMVVSGRRDMTGEPDPEATSQLQLRYRHGALLCESFVAAGFVAVHADNMFGTSVTDHLASLQCPRALIVLRPSPESIERRIRERGGAAYDPWVPDGGTLLDAIRQFDTWVGEIPPVGLWIDSSAQTVDDTVDEILRRWSESFVD